MPLDFVLERFRYGLVKDTLKYRHLPAPRSESLRLDSCYGIFIANIPGKSSRGVYGLSAMGHRPSTTANSSGVSQKPPAFRLSLCTALGVNLGRAMAVKKIFNAPFSQISSQQRLFH
jgi:hypothetical protein